MIRDISPGASRWGFLSFIYLPAVKNLHIYSVTLVAGKTGLPRRKGEEYGKQRKN